MSKKELMCRFCLKIPDKEPAMVDEVTSQMCDSLQIKLDFNVFRNPVMCESCSETIERLYAFKSLCVDTQDLILLSNVRENRGNINLRSIYKAKTNLSLDQDADICRVCMKPSKDGLMSIEALNKNPEFMKMWTKYMAEVDLDVTKIPKICSHCKDNVQCYFKFVLDMETVEGRINTYRESVGRKEEPILVNEALNHLNVDALGYSDGPAQMCSIMTEYVTNASTESSRRGIYEIKDDPDMKEESYISENSLAYPERHIQNYVVKQEPNTDDQIRKIDNELNIKEEKGNYDESVHDNFAMSTKSTEILGKNVLYESKSLHVLLAEEDQSLYLNPSTSNSTVKETLRKCAMCSFQTNKKGDLKNHLIENKDHSELIFYKCLQCPFETYWKHALLRHIERHATSETYKCVPCNFTTTFKTHFKRHMDAHDSLLDKKMHKCTVCDYKTAFKASHKRHMLEHGDKSELQIYKCTQCEYKTHLKKYLKQHVLVHRDLDEIPRYACTVCPYITYNKYSFRRHSLVHKSSTELEMQECTICDFKTRHKRNLFMHLKTHKNSSELEMHRCDQCSYETHRKDMLTRHAVVHKSVTDAQMYRCAICAFVTKHKHGLKKHISKHNKTVSEFQESVTFKCFHCPFESNAKSYLKVHIDVKHRDEAEVTIYSCALCSYKTKYKYHLKEHAKSHEAQSDVYECEVCQFKTICKRVIFKHKKTHE